MRNICRIVLRIIWTFDNFTFLFAILCMFGYVISTHVTSLVDLWQYSAKLLKKPDQCRAVVSCSHLFWVEGDRGVRDGER